MASAGQLAVLGAAAVLGFGLAVASPAAASTADGSSRANPVHEESTSAQKSDVVPAAELNADWVTAFNLLSTQLEERFPDSFAGSEIAADMTSGWIGFKDEVPAEVEKLAAGVSGVEIRGGLGYSAYEVIETIGAILDTTAHALGPGASVTAYQNGNADQILLAVGPAPSTDTDRSSDDASARFADAATAKAVEDVATDLAASIGFDVDVKLSTSPVAGTEAFDGGRVLAGVCTGGFPIKRNGGAELGILTAGHCPGTGSYSGVANAFYPVYPFSLSTSYGVPGGDFRWNHSKTMLTGKTYVGSSSTRAFAAGALASVGSGICNYGKSTSYKCSTVAYTNLSSTVWVPDGNAYYDVGPLRGVSGHITEYGDSGGPWFYGTTAYGIHYGFPDGHSAWSNVTYALQKLGVSLWVG